VSAGDAALALVLESARLVLRPVAVADADALSHVARTGDIADTMITVPDPLTPAVAREWIDGERAAMGAGRAVTLAVRRLGDPAVVGVTSLRHIDRDHACAELSFWLSPAVRGAGLATEAAEAVLAHGFAALALNRVEAYHMVRNAASGRVLARLRFQPEGLLRSRVIKRGIPEDVRLWSRLRTD